MLLKKSSPKLSDFSISTIFEGLSITSRSKIHHCNTVVAFGLLKFVCNGGIFVNKILCVKETRYKLKVHLEWGIDY